MASELDYFPEKALAIILAGDATQLPPKFTRKQHNVPVLLLIVFERECPVYSRKCLARE